MNEKKKPAGVLVTTYDVKAESYSPPFAFPTRGVALRSVADMVAKPQSEIARHPEDFRFYITGYYDILTGELIANDKPEYLCSAEDLVEQITAARTPQPAKNPEEAKA